MFVRSRITRTACLSLVLAAAACGGDSTGPGPNPDPVLGTTYQLQGVEALGNLGGGGSGLPVTFTDGSGKTLRFDSGSLVLGEDDSYDLTVNVAFQGDEYDAGDLGTYSVQGSSLSLVSELDGSTYSGTVSGSTLKTTYRVAGQQFELTLTEN